MCLEADFSLFKHNKGLEGQDRFDLFIFPPEKQLTQTPFLSSFVNDCLVLIGLVECTPSSLAEVKVVA